MIYPVVRGLLLTPGVQSEPSDGTARGCTVQGEQDIVSLQLPPSTPLLCSYGVLSPLLYSRVSMQLIEYHFAP
ncbi:hypothetical protein DFH06DRAFT_1212123, partial [Mycena polygramma]